MADHDVERALVHRAWVAAVALVAVAVWAPTAAAQPKELNGFRLEPSAIPLEAIRRGGPPRDGIPALDAPTHVAVSEANWDEDEPVVGVVVDGQARAYPLAILAWHELVNDTVAGRPILVSHCPLCGTAMVFDRRVEGEVLRFGVSGLLYQSDLLMFDRASDSLWSQITARAETGPRMGTRLALMRSRIERWGRWKSEHPEGQVLSRETGHAREYDRTPYGDYDRSPELYFPVPRDDRYHPKMPTLGLRLADGTARAYPASELRAAGGRVAERFAGRDVTVRYDLNARVFSVDAPDDVEVVEGYWFAWAAFHPGSEVYVAPEREAAE